ncbi:MAG: type IV pilus modification PilV family protein [Puniceicoccales bacterium]
MSLLETMIAMVIFMMLAIGLTSAVLQSQQISQNNVIRNTAYTIAQGYLEQIKSLSQNEITLAIADPKDTPLPTKSISALSTSTIEIDDSIYLDGPDRKLSGQNDGSNFREILIDLQVDDDGEETKEVVMESWFDIDVEAMENRSHSYAITVRFEAKLRGNMGIVRGVLRGIRSDLNEAAIQ